MIAQATTILCKEIVTLLQSTNHVLETVNIDTTYSRKFLHITGKSWFLNIHRSIRTPSWNHFNFKTTLTSYFMPM